ncbi:MAG: hypothetical protein A2176_04755 [Spirochaetes bacterium RBG_13_51_14]|nr:MAG: hypothetical protein A2176_04755 [Spirochaetes bacterium RBG_13_51_14]
MKKLLIISIFLLNYFFVYCDQVDSKWNKILNDVLPIELKDLRLINDNDIKDQNNLEIIKERNPDYVFKINDKNSKSHIVLPCKSKKKTNDWYIVIIQEDHAKYKLVNYFNYKFRSFFVFKLIFNHKEYIHLGEYISSDFFIDLIWDGKSYKEFGKTVNLTK